MNTVKEEIENNLQKQISSIFTEWCNADYFRGSWGRLTLDKALAIFEALRSGNSPLTLALTSAHYEITNSCNSKCIHCNRWNWEKNTTPSIKQAFNILESISLLGIKTITLGGGEPLLYEDFPLLTSKAVELGSRLGVITNGLFITPTLLESLCNNTEWIRFSLDAADNKTYKTIRGVQGGFQRVISNIRKLVDYRRLRTCSKPKIGINFVVQAGNYRSISNIIKISKENEVDTVLFKIVHGKGPFMLNHDAVVQMRKEIERILSSDHYASNTNLDEFLHMITKEISPGDIESGFPLKSFYSKEKLRCFVPFFFLTIDQNGFFYPCDYLLFDTRDGAEYQKHRMQYRIGQVMDIKDEVFSPFQKFKSMLKMLSVIDTGAIPECGCCTRFYRFNKYMNLLYYEYIKLCKDTTSQKAIDLFSNAIASEVKNSKLGWL
jgi:MoaA/NifB/PqqE/SkfB family radical SAM enzyme